jgi:hypothetical protein
MFGTKGLQALAACVGAQATNFVRGQWCYSFTNRTVYYTQGHIYARAKGARAQGGILKKIEIEVWYAGKKGSPQERNLREIYTEYTIFCQFFVLFLLTHN